MSDVTPQLGSLDQVRFLLGDVDASNQLLNDSEIYYGLDQKGGSVKSAAAMLARVIANRLALQVQPYALADYREADGAKLAKTYLETGTKLGIRGHSQRRWRGHRNLLRRPQPG